MTDAMRKGSDVHIFLILQVVHGETIPANSPMDHLATRDVLGVGETSDLRMHLLHGQDLTHTRLAVSDAALKLFEALAIALRPKAFGLQASSLAVKNVSHARIL